MKYFKPELFDNKSNVTITIKASTSCKTWCSAQSHAQRENLFIIPPSFIALANFTVLLLQLIGIFVNMKMSVNIWAFLELARTLFSSERIQAFTKPPFMVLEAVLTTAGKH